VSRGSKLPRWMRPKCSVCGKTWRDCGHAGYEDIYRHRLWTFIVGGLWSLVSLVLIGVCVVLPLISLFG